MPTQTTISNPKSEENLKQLRVLNIEEFCTLFGICRSRYYEEKNLGRLISKKSGKRVLIEMQEAERWFRELPNAKPKTSESDGPTEE